MSSDTTTDLDKHPPLDEQAKRNLRRELSEIEDSLAEMQTEAVLLPYKSLYAQLLLCIILLCGCMYVIAFPYLPVSTARALPTEAPALALLIGLIAFYWMSVVIKKLRLLRYVLQKARRAQQRGETVLRRGKQMLE